MVKKKEQMTNEEREKMLVRLADMRQKVADNRKARTEAGGAESKPNIEIFGNAKIDIKKPVPKKPDELMLEKLDRVASHLEELTTYKKEKVAAKKAKEQQEQKIKEDIARPPPTPVAAPTFQFPRSHGNPFFQGGKF